ncbi:ROK family protein [Neptuniibacter sp. QD29_5]|uniref:ROK family protein n=1 Tax=Neptuniibacter sp. QD29_5 TaxID=3398207 RepID=UPI0039F4C6B2
MDYCIGIDLGGTKIEIIALTPSSDVLFRYRVPTPQGNYQATLDAIFSLAYRKS